MSEVMPQPLALVIEDEKNLADIFQDVVSEVGYRTLVRNNGRDGLETLDEIVPNLVLLDLNLPFVSGDEILKRIRGDKRFDETKIVIITGNARRADALRNDGDYVLDKPISYDQLRALSERLIPPSE